MNSISRHPRVWIVYYVLALLISPFVSGDGQVPLGQFSNPPKRVAVIGAGAAGSSTAYSLRKYADASSTPVDITVFERASYIGGRSTTVNVFGNPAYPIELGASIFVEVNYNLVNASRDLGLVVKSASQARPKESEDVIGVWDGKEFVFRMQDTYSWWNIAKLIWQYGWAPVRTQNLMKATVNQFLRLYEEPIFPFKSLTAAAMRVGLLNTTATRGSEFLNNNHVSADFSRDIIQASTRVNYGQNLGLIHGLEAMVCMATDGAMAIQGGNWQLFDAMLKASHADVKLNHTVSSVERNRDSTLTVTYSNNDSAQKKLVFDEVVIAGPLQYSDIALDPIPEHTPDKIPYVQLHVTLFSSPHQLSPKYFNLQGPDARAPETILTTLPRGVDLGSSEKGVGPANFWSISTLQTVDSEDHPGESHYVYKIFSPERPSAKFMRDILGLEHPENSSPADNTTIGDLPKEDISWYYEKIWHPYPFLHPRVTFEDTLISPNLWYTGGIESFISTMETSAHMGKNVAALMSQSWQGEALHKRVGQESTGESRAEL
ncbi:putative prenylcysteine lyase [Aspergillus steynii IBT 23096]|uniref:Putative prenylcysteine lyase n=1 Tax=Aspergillus steynii IBT 23096 TaxID=1392250 RepID=A0A2I2GJY1_9EURO|nr:putative prenylcysteine lyase [Aspergillus steynii IBT 23096]PLB53180.1 putative prenylcysteine lyase [Aspergillus steynii IBT 23096]